MNYESLLAAHQGRRLRIGLVGAGEFGQSLLFRSGRAASIEVVAVADRDVQRATAAAGRAGMSGRDIEIVDDAARLVELPLDLVVEATGEPESAARVAELAIAKGRHVAMVTKEADCVIGPILQAKAAEAGLVCTPVDGDQPSLLIALVSWARLLGLDIVCAGKSGEFDFVCDPRLASVTGPEGTRALHDGAGFWTRTEQRAGVLGGWTTVTVPDHCELTIVANATGLKPDIAALHAPVARTLELPNLFRPRAKGGLLHGDGVVDMFVCLRRDDELSFAGGVFVVVRCDDLTSWEVLRGKGIPVSDDGGYALLHNPVHLLGIEAPVSLISAVMLRAPAALLQPRYDLQARATAELAPGTVFALGFRHTIGGLESIIAPASRVSDATPVPYYMLAGCRLRRAVAPGAVITRADVDPPEDSTLWRLRAEQDARFFAA
jgi:predicted homoserine dehydrogenase-like protein